MKCVMNKFLQSIKLRHYGLPVLLGLALGAGQTDKLVAGQAVSPEITIRIEADSLCPTGYRADDTNTEEVEQACLQLNFEGFEAFARQGIGLFVDANGNFRDVWFLSDLRPEAHPPQPVMVSPIVHVKFKKDESCPSTYSLSDLTGHAQDQACAAYDLDGLKLTGLQQIGLIEDKSGVVRNYWYVSRLSF